MSLVLVADDGFSIRQVTEPTLEPSGFSTLSADNGLDTLVRAAPASLIRNYRSNTMYLMESSETIPQRRKRVGILVEFKRPLSKREFEVLCLLADGLTTKAIAAIVSVTF
jgi:DNA-binding NarL/FixJ family response regulator